MKKTLLFSLLVSFILTSCGSAPKEEASKKEQTFFHSTYIMSSRIKSQEMIKSTDFETFDYIYIMAYPKFKDMDFSLPLETIIDSLVTNFEYPKDENGVELVAMFVKEAQKNGTKIMLSFAHRGFLEIVENQEYQDKFAELMVQFIDKYGYDGIEVDWEHTVTLPLHAEFMRNIRARLDQKYPNEHKYLTTALHSWQRYTPELAAEVSKDVDWFNLMSYDIGGGNWGETPSHNTPMDVIETDLKYWLSVFDRDKVTMGLANYGFIYRGISPNESTGDPVGLKKCGAYISYNEALEFFNQGWEPVYDSVAEVCYYFSPDKKDFITMENPETIIRKMDWAIENGYNRAFWWEFDYDIVPPTTEGGKVSHRLIDVVDEYITKKGMR